MSGLLDNPVVQMVLDTTGFNDKAEEAIVTIAKLKASMAFEGAITGLNTLADSIKNSGIDTLQTGVYKVHQEFDALNVIATTTLENITNKAISTGETLLQSLTTTPLKEGLQEYETQINSVQTILSNTGEALKSQGLESEHDRIEKINGVLDELNKYADMTIYNFTEMTRNIGTFTAAGVELDKSASAIKGIANLAAMSGSNSEQASRAMYQLSQALSMGTLKLQDWNSVVNAGMGGKLFQDELKDTARTLGIVASVTEEVDKLDEYGNAVIDETTGETVKKKVKQTINDVDQLIEHEGSFRESLSSGWITEEILLTTLEKFTAGSEGYTKAQIEQMRELWAARGYSQKQIEELVGSVHELTDTEEENLRTKWAEKGFSPEQIDHILSMGMAATDAATKVKTFSQLIDTVKEALQSGWTQSWEYIFGDFEQAKRFWTEISDLMNMYIGKSADSRNSILKEWSEATYTYSEDGKLMMKQLDEEAEAGYRLVEVEQMENNLLGGREAIIQGLRNVFQGFLEIVLQLKEAFASNFWGNADLSFVSDISLSGQKLIDVSHQFLNATQNFKNSLIGDNGEATDKLKALRGVFDYFAQGVRAAYDGLVKIGSTIANVLHAMFSSTDIIATMQQAATMVNAVTLRFREFADIINKHFAGGNAKNFNGLRNFFKGLSDLFMQNVWDKLEFIANGVMAIIHAIDRMISPFGTAGEILGKVGEKLSEFSKALFDLTHDSNGISKFDTMFNSVVDNFIKFYDILRQNVDFSGFAKMFGNLMTALSDDKVGIFRSFTKLFEIFSNLIKVILQILVPFGAAFTKVFGDSFTKAGMFISSVVERIRAFSQSLVANGDTIKGIQHLFEGFFNIVKAIGEVLGGVFLTVWDTIVKLFGEIAPKGNEVGQTLTDIGDAMNNFAGIIRGFASSGAGGVITTFLTSLVHLIQNLFGLIGDLNPLQRLHDLFISLGEGLKRALGGTEDMTLLDTILQKLKDFFNGIKEMVSTDGAIDPNKALFAGGASVFITNLITNIGDLSKKVGGLTGIIGTIKKFIKELGEVISAFTLKFNIEAVKTVATAILEIAAAMFILAMIDPEALVRAIGAISVMFAEIKTILELVNKFKKTSELNLAAAAGTITAFGTAVLELAVAVSILGDMKPEKLAQGLVAVGILLAALTKVAEQFSKFQADMVAGAGALVLLAVALDLLVIPVKSMAKLSWEEMAKGLVATIALMGALVGAAIAMTKWGDGFKASMGVGMILMAAAIKILASAVKDVSDLSWEGVAKGLAVMAVGIIGFVAAVKLLSDSSITGGNGKVTEKKNPIIQVAAGLIAMAVSMKILVSAISDAGKIPFDQLKQGLIVVGGGLAAFVAFSYLVDGKKLLMAGIGILAIATAVTELVLALNLAQMIQPIVQAITIGVQSLSNAFTQMANNAATQSFLDMLISILTFLPKLAIALADCVIQFVVTLGNGAAQIAIAVGQIAAAVLGTLMALVPQLGQLVLTILAEIGRVVVEGAPIIGGAIMTILSMMWEILIAQLPNFFAWLGVLADEFTGFLTEHGPALIQAIALIIDTILQAIITEAPRFGEAVLTVLATILATIIGSGAMLFTAVCEILLMLLRTLAEYVPQMADAGLDILFGFLGAILEHIGEIVIAGVQIGLAVLKGISEQAGPIVQQAFELVISFINGLAEAIRKDHDELFKAVGNLLKAILEALKDGALGMARAAGDLIGHFIEGFDGEQFLKDLADVGHNLVKGIINGITGFMGAAGEAAANLGKEILNFFGISLEEHSPSKATERMGKFFVQGFIEGASSLTDNLQDDMSKIAYGAIDGFNSGLTGVEDIEPAITPVIDDSGIQNGIDSMKLNFDDTVLQTANITGTLDASNQLKTQLSDAILAGSDYSKITNVLGKLRKDLADYTDAASNMKVIMDNGVLVGELTPGIDQNLGLMSRLSRRGVI